MQRFIIIRCLYALLVLFIVSVIVFGLARLSGNPVDVFLPFDAGPAQERAWNVHWAWTSPCRFNT